MNFHQNKTGHVQQVFYKNKTYVRPGYIPLNQKQVVVAAAVAPSPKFLLLEQQIEESVMEEQEFDQWMNECMEMQRNTLLEDECDFIRETCVSLMSS